MATSCSLKTWLAAFPALSSHQQINNSRCLEKVAQARCKLSRAPRLRWCTCELEPHHREVQSSPAGTDWLHRPGYARLALALAVTGALSHGFDPSFFDSQQRPLVHRVGGVETAHAALFQMPPFKLNNRYYLVRAGESIYEQRGVINTNPVRKTFVESGLSEEGKRQTLQAARVLKYLGACDGNCWIWPSINQRAYQSAEIIAALNDINRSRIVPEYSFLDARGLGAFEGRALAAYQEVYDMDSESSNWRPPPYFDGTPNESVADVLVRVTQLMSVLETQYFGDSVVVVSPDSDNLSVLQAALTGMDLRRHSILAFAPGEVRTVDIITQPIPSPRFSGLVKCYNPPSCM